MSSVICHLSFVSGTRGAAGQSLTGRRICLRREFGTTVFSTTAEIAFARMFPYAELTLFYLPPVAMAPISSPTRFVNSTNWLTESCSGRSVIMPPLKKAA